MWEKNESVARKKLWDLTIKNVKHGEWIICLDADEFFVKYHLKFVNYLMIYFGKYDVSDVDSLGFKLFDMWNNNQYRSDKWWTAHLRDWCMAIRFDETREYKWSDNKLHCGRFPLNAALKMYTSLVPIMHLGWSTQELREEKYNRYIKVDPDNAYGIKAQYDSILDKNPNLLDLDV
jgi:hypothetical protein